MRYADLQWTDVEQIQGLVTNIDEADLRQDFALRLRGGRLATEGMVYQRDYGTKFRYATSPTLTGATLTIVGGTTMYDSVGKSEHEVLICVDQNNNMHIFVYNSGWIELTETFTSTIQAVAGATIDIGNAAGNAQVNNSMGSAITPAIHQFQAFLIYNQTKAEYQYCTDSTAATLPATYARLTLYREFSATSGRLNWSVNDVVVCYRSPAMIGGIANLANGATPLVTFKEIQEQRKLTLFIANSDSSPTARTTLQIRQISADAMKFGYGAAGLINPPAGFYLIEAGAGALPFFVADGTEVAPHGSETRSTFSAHSLGVCDSTGDGTNIAVTGGGILAVLAEGMTVDDGAGEQRQITAIVDDSNFTIDTAFSSPLIEVDCGLYIGAAVQIGDGHGNNWLQIRNTVLDAVSGDGHYHLLRLVIVPILDGYQYGDPIYKSYMLGAAARYPQPNLDFMMNWEKAPKNISGLYVYIQETDGVTNPSFAQWPDAPDEYKLVYKCEFRTVSDDSRSWRGTGTGTPDPDFTAENYFYRFTCTRMTEAMVDAEFVLNLGNLEGDLNRAPTYTGRVYYTPRFGVTAARKNQGAIGAIDTSDQVIRLSIYSGDGIHNDDIFPPVEADANSQRLQVQLLGSGELMGMVFMNSTLFCLRRADMDIYDIIANKQDLVTIDCIARRSIVSTDVGVFWAGQNFIYWMPSDGGQIVPINKPWANYYNGSLRASGGTPLVNAAQRAAIISGWDKFYGEAWFVVESEKEDDSGTEVLCWRYSVRDRRWNVRKLANNTRPGFFATNRNDNTLIIGTSAGTLSYPNIASAYPRRDLVTSADTGGYGFESSVLINMGSVSGMARRVIPAVLLIDFAGSNYNSAQVFSIQPFGGRASTGLQSAWTLALAGVNAELYFEPVGSLESLRLLLSLPTTQANLDECDRWEVYRMSLGYRFDPKRGTL